MQPRDEQVEVKQRDHGNLRGEVSTITVHMEHKQEKERLARERVETLEVGTKTRRQHVVDCCWSDIQYCRPPLAWSHLG